MDARTIKLDQRTLSALYHANLRSELTRRLGVRWQSPEHGISEIADIDPDVLAEFSYVAVEDNQAALDVLTQAIGRDWIDQPAVERRSELGQRHSPASPGGRPEEEMARLEDQIRRIAGSRVMPARPARATVDSLLGSGARATEL